MNSMKIPSLQEPPSPGERRSAKVFAIALGLIALAMFFPELPRQLLYGLTWAVVGILMLVWPPRHRPPHLWTVLGLGFIAVSALGFLPVALVTPPPWRGELEALGLDLGSSAYVQPRLAFQGWIGFAVTALFGIYLFGHRVGKELHHRLAIACSLLLGGYALLAILTHDPGEVFGFFPNRNHTATLLVVGLIVSVGSLMQSIRDASGWRIAASVAPAATCLIAVLMFSVSRAGILLLLIGCLALLPLLGRRSLGGHAGKAVLLVVGGAIAAFLLIDSSVKDRILDTFERASTPRESVITSDGDAPAATTPLTVFGRLSIFQDTLEMIRREPWTGVGPNQFVYAFQHHRDRTTSSNAAINLHPESDWLFLAAETGVIAAALVLAALTLVLIHVARASRRGRARALRVGCLVAAALVPIHGIFDVPGHRLAPAWLCLLLFALCLRPTSFRGSLTDAKSWQRRIWQVPGAALVALGAAMLVAAWNGQDLSVLAQAEAQFRSAQKLFEEDQAAYEEALELARVRYRDDPEALAEAVSEGTIYTPDPDEGPLAQALEKATEAAALVPLEPRYHHAYGAFALYFGGRDDLARRGFEIERELVPVRINIPVRQAAMWLSIEPGETLALWVEAMDRAAAEDRRHPDSHTRGQVYREILRYARAEPRLQPAALKLARNRPALIELWLAVAEPEQIEANLENILARQDDPEVRQTLEAAAKKRLPDEPSGTE